MHAAPLAVDPAHSSQSFPRWLLLLLLFLLAVSFVINILQGRKITRLRKDQDGEDYEFPGWGDEKDAVDAITDPDLPAYGYERPEPELAHDEPVPDTVIFGRVVDEDHWAEEATIPAPEIVANPVHHERAMAWIEQWEAEDAARQLTAAGSR